MNEPPTRLEQALEVFLEHQSAGVGRERLLSDHPDLADLLEAFFDDEPAPAPGGDEPGRSFGEFMLLRELGRGGVGAVFEARQRGLDRRVALKVLHDASLRDPTARARFRREALTLAKLDHPGIVRVLDAGDHDGIPWLALEFVEGQSLAQRLDQLRAAGGHSGSSLRDLLEVIAAIAEALEHAHAAGVVHRDVKPSNVLLRDDGRAVLGDFGLARDAGDPSLTRTGTVAGTPYYMAPEQVRGSVAECDARGDVFSLGSTLYECLTLERPFDGPSTDVVLRRILTTDPVDPRRAQPRLPRELSAIVLVAMDKDPARRYPTAKAFAEDLRAFLDLRPVQARPPSTVRRVVRFARREPLRAALALLVVFAVALGVAFLEFLPEIRAGERARGEAEYERALAAGLMARANQDGDETFRQLGRALSLFPERGEAIAMWCLAVRNFNGPAAALAELDRRAAGRQDPDLGWMRVMLLRRCDRRAEADLLEARLGEPRSATSLWLAGVLATDGDPSAADRRRALTLVSLATRVASSPRLLLHLQWAGCANGARDDVAKRESSESLLRLWPDEPVALHYAAANLQDSEPARAADLQRRALELGLDDPNGLRNLGAYLYKAGRPTEWVEPLLRHLELHPDDGLRDAFFGMLDEHGLFDVLDVEARRWYAREPDDPLAVRWMGRAVYREDERGSQLFFRRAVAMLPGDPEAHYELAVATDDEADRAECLRELADVLELAPDHERAHGRLLGILRDRSDAAGVRAELQRWVAVRPDDRDGWLQLAVDLAAAVDTAQRTEALVAFDRADVLAGGKDPELLERKARLLDDLGSRAAAVACRERAAAIVR